MNAVQDEHQIEVNRGERFEFGKNWARFLKHLNDRRISLAERSLVDMLGRERFDGLTFLDVGSGSGLFSLAARRLGARVHSFDYDPSSYGCTLELKRRYFPDDPTWVVERGSVLDEDYLAKLGTFDVVYSWGVLHHTGQMWRALENVKPLVKMGGQLFIAIYNDLGVVTDRWWRVKKRYNKLPAPINTIYMLAVFSQDIRKEVLEAARNGKLVEWWRNWSNYETVDVRGMTRWRDMVDWFGGYPYERATIEDIVDAYSRDGFQLDKLVDLSLGYGCNEFVFSKVAGLGSFVETNVRGGLTFHRRYGRRVIGPLQVLDGAWVGKVALPAKAHPEAEYILFRDGKLLGPVAPKPDGSVEVAPGAESSGAVEASTFFVVAALRLSPPDRPFAAERGNMWSWDLPDFASWADDTSASHQTSPVFVFEGDTQLPRPHALHDDIRTLGDGRFSHWQRRVYFAPLGNVDPNLQKDRFSLLVAAEALA